jgi:hypothetical protein
MVAPSPRPSDPLAPSAQETAAYIESLVSELAVLAAHAGLPGLAFRLEHARSAAAEAAAILRQDPGRRAAYPPGSDTA